MDERKEEIKGIVSRFREEPAAPLEDEPAPVEPRERQREKVVDSYSFLSENILPIQESGQLKFVDIGRRSAEENVYLRDSLPGIDVFVVNGHTDAMMVPVMTYKGRTMAFMADLLPSVHHIPLPWVMAYDTRPLLTLAEKRDFLNMAAKEEIVLFFEHDPVNQCATVELTEKGVRLKETFPLSAL